MKYLKWLNIALGIVAGTILILKGFPFYVWSWPFISAINANTVRQLVKGTNT